MFYVLQNEGIAARRRVPILLTDAATGTTAQSGIASTNIYSYVNINGGAFIGGTGSISESGFGQYYYEFQSNEVATLGLAGIHITAPGCRNYDAIVQIAALNLYSASSGTTAGDVWSYAGGRTITGGIADTVTTLTDRSGFAITGGTITTVSDKTGYSLSASQTFDLTGNVIGSVSGAVGSVTSPVDVSTSSMSGIANTVWTYGSRTVNGGTIDNATVSTIGSTAIESIWRFSLTGVSPLFNAGDAGYQLRDVGNIVWAQDISASIALPNSAAHYLDIAATGTGISAGDVWSYGSRTITGGIADTVTTVTNRSGFAITGGTVDTVTNAVDVSTASISGIANTVWATDISGYTSPSAGFDLTQSASGSGLTSGDVSVAVWDSPVASYTTNGTFGLNILRSDNAGIAGSVTVWTGASYNGVYADAYRIDASYDASTALKNILTGIGSSITSNITGNITGDLSGSVGSVTADVNVSTTSMAGIADTVWNYVLTNTATADTMLVQTGTVGDLVWSLPISGYEPGSAGYDLTQAAYGGAGISAYDVWNFDPTAMTSPQAGAILTDIQTDTNSIITDIGNIPNNVWVSDVSGYVNPGEAGFELTQAATGVSAGDVWNYVLSNSNTAEVNLVAASAGGGLTAGAVANAVWNAQLATYATPGTGEVFGSDTYGTKLVRTIIKDRPAAIDTSQRITSVVAALNANVITATSIQAAAITSAKFATDAITSTVIAADAITSAELAPSANTEIADAVWAYATRNITGGTITTVSDKTGYSLSGSQTFNLTGDIAGNITGNLSGSVGSVGNVTTIDPGAISASSFLAGAIDATALASDAVTEIANGVWSVGTRTITGGTITTVSDKTGYSLSGTQSFNLTGNITGNLSGSVGSVSGSVGSVTGAVGSVTGAVGSVTGSVGSVIGAVGSVTGAVGSVTGSVGSVTADVNVSTASMTGIAGTVWSTDISSYTSPSAGYSLAVAGSGGVSAADVWNYNGGRTITGGIADTVTSITNGVTVTTNNDKTGYALSGTQSFNLTGNITGNLSGSVGSVSGNVTGSVGSVVGAVGSVTSPVSVSTTSMSGIAGTVWNTDISGITTAGTAGKKLNDAASGVSTIQIINGPYRLTSTAEGTDGRLDILQDSVQSIELQLIDSFGSPINIGGNYTLSVDVYDESGALTVSYVPTTPYAAAGLLNFDLDTDVTGVLGRYTIVVSLTDGDVIQVGPLQVLVRPL